MFFIDLFFICSLRGIIRKKHTNTYGKDSKYTNAIDISISGCSVGSAGGRGDVGVGGVGSFIVCTASISATFFLHRLKYFVSTYSYSFLSLCELPQHVLVLL